MSDAQSFPVSVMGNTFPARGEAPRTDGALRAGGRSAVSAGRMCARLGRAIAAGSVALMLACAVFATMAQSAQAQSLTITNDFYSTGPTNRQLTFAAERGAITKAVFRVELDRPATQDVTVDWATEDGTATAGDDYTSNNGRITIRKGHRYTSEQIEVTVLDDDIWEPSERFRVRLQNPVNATISTAVGIAEIFNDDPPPPVYISIRDATAVEGETMEFKVELVDRHGNPRTDPVDFDITIGTKIFFGNNDDPERIIDGETVRVAWLHDITWEHHGFRDFTIPAGSLSTTVPVRTLRDALPSTEDTEGTEKFEMTLFSRRPLDRGLRRLRSRAIGTIEEGELVPAAFIPAGFVIWTSETKGTAEIEVRLNQVLNTTVRIAYETQENWATSPEDFRHTSGTLVFSPGETSKTVVVPIVADNVYEGTGEGFYFRLVRVVSGPPHTIIDRGRANGAALDTAWIVIAPDRPGVSEQTIAERLTAAFRDQPVSHDGVNPFTVRLAFTEDVEITPEDLRDHALSASNGTVTGVSRVEGAKDLFEVTIEPSGDEKVTVRFVPASGGCDAEGAVCTADGVALTGLHATNVRGPGPGLTVADTSAREGEDDTLDFVVTLSPAASGTVTVKYATSDGTATEGEDYYRETGELIFDPNETSKTVSVRIVDDAVEDDGETVKFTLSDAMGAAIDDPEAVGTIRNTEVNANTPSGTPGIAADPALTAEFRAVPSSHDGSTAFTFELHFSEEFRVGHRTLRDSAFDVVGGTVRKAKRLTRGSNIGWGITVEPDTDGDTVIALPVRACGTTGATCTDDDRALSDEASATIPGPASPPRISIAAVTPTVTEGTAASFTLSRRGGPATALTVDVSVSEAGSMVDGTAPSTATFAAGSATATLTVATADDEVAEIASVIEAAVSSGTGYALESGAGSASVTVEDDDAVPAIADTGPFTVDEYTTAIATLVATDGDTADSDLVWSVVGGTDADKVTLSAAGVLAFKAAKDFESPDDADGDGAYMVTVRVTDGANPVDAVLTVQLADLDEVAPVLSDASVDGAVLTLTFDEALDTGAPPASSAFTVKVDEAARRILTVSVSGSAVTLTLASAVVNGDTVTVGYAVPTGDGASPLRDPADNPAAAFSDRAVTNLLGLPRISIASTASSVTEGTAASFTLNRTGDTAAALTVSVSVSEAGSVLSGTPASTVTFATGSAEATLNAATEDDAVDEADARVTASVSAGSGYRVDSDAGSARVDVYDDDAAVAGGAKVTTLWSSTLQWTDLDGEWLIANAKDFTSASWSEDGRDYRIWYISYDPWGAELWVRLDQLTAGIPNPEELTLQVGDVTLGSEQVATFARGGQGDIAIVTGVEQDWEEGGRVSVRLTRTVAAADATASLPGISVADAEVHEANGVPLSFGVTLSQPRTSPVSVRYATSDGTAVAGSDYEAVSGMVRFEPGQTAKTVSVPVLDDDHDEGSETLTLTLSQPFGATISDGTATGTIANTDPMPKAWIARFGRTVAEQVLEAVESRMRAPRTPGAEVSLGGRRVGGAAAPDGGVAGDDGGQPGAGRSLAEWFRDGTGPERRHGLEARTMTQRDFLLGSSFSFTGGTAETGSYALWGRGAVTRFDGRDGALSLTGEVTSGMLGADWNRDALTAGLMVSHSLGEGSYGGESGNGAVSSSLTGLYPWGRYALSERLSVWGVAGYGEGTLTLTPSGQAPIRTDLDLMMAAAGLRGVLVRAPETGGLELAVKSDALGVRTSTAKAQGLVAAAADVTRLRLGLEGLRSFRFEGGASLVPSVEIGMRQDGGDAETGFGIDIGGGLSWSDPRRGLSAEFRGRALLSHAADGFRERGFSGSLSWDPTPDTARGLSFSMSQSLGARASGGMDALLERGTLAGLAANDDGESGLGERRFQTRLGYGLSAFGDRFTGTPEIGFGFSGEWRDFSLGWRLAREARSSDSLDLSLEARRRESANDNAYPVHEIGVRVTAHW